MSSRGWLIVIIFICFCLAAQLSFLEADMNEAFDDNAPRGFYDSIRILLRMNH